jgi:uncharacterized membrane protein YeaQ/YmgE (transglycosylase-associated protein family)
VSVLVAPMTWVMAGLALWHFTIFLPDRFIGGILGTLVAALLGAVAAGLLLPQPGLPGSNPPGLGAVAIAVAGATVALAASAVWQLRAGRTEEAPER